MAAALLRKYLADRRCTAISVSSAGTHAPLGGSADERAVLLSREYGMSLESHRTQPLGASLVAESNFILVMDHRNEAELLARYPEAQDKVFLLGAVRAGGGSRTAEIPDPHFGTLEDVRRCFAALQTCVGRLAIVLASTETNP
jgi:protein-tyrosine phosphatase